MAGDQTTNGGQNDPDSPTDWQQIGKAVAAGMDAIGFIEKLGKAVVGGSVEATRKARAYGIRAIAVVVSAVAGALFDLIGQLDPAFGSLAATIVGNMFEVEVDASAFTNMKGAGGRKQIAIDVGAALLKAFRGDQTDVGPGELQPSLTAAESYLGVMSNLAIEGWAFEVIGGMFPDLELETIGSLKDSMARVLGLGRLSRTVLRPYITTLVSTPAQWALNKQYRPKMLSVPEAIAAWFRGDVDESTMREIAARDGYGDDAIAALINAARKHQSPSDLFLRVQNDQLEQADMIAALRAAGYEDGPANELYNLELLRARLPHVIRMADAAVTAFAEHRIDEPALLDAISGLGLSDTKTAWLHDEARARAAGNVPHLSHGEVIAAVKRGVLNVTDYAAWLSARGYSDVDAATLELTLQDELNELADKAAARAKATATRAANAAAKLQAQQAARDRVASEHLHWTGTLGEAERLVVRFIMPPVQYRQVLIDHGLSPGDADALVNVAVQDRDARAAAAQKRLEAAAKGQHPIASLAALEHAVLIGARTIDALRAELQARNYPADDVQLLVDLVTRELADRTALQAKRDALAAAGGGKVIALAQLEAAVLAGDATLDQYRARLAADKYSAVDAGVLVALLQSKLKDHAFAVERRAIAEQKLEASHVSLANEEKAVIDGILTLADYRLWLAAHDFDDADQAVMTALLEEKLAKKAGGP